MFARVGAAVIGLVPLVCDPSVILKDVVMIRSAFFRIFLRPRSMCMTIWSGDIRAILEDLFFSGPSRVQLLDRGCPMHEAFHLLILFKL